MARIHIDPHLDDVVEFDDVSIAMPRHARRAGGNRRQRLRRLAGESKRHELEILSGVTARIRPGESVAILSTPDGGRDEFLRLAAGTLIPDRGTVRRNQIVSAMLERSGSLSPTHTIRQNLYLLGGLLGLAPSEVSERLPAIVEFLDLGKKVDAYLNDATPMMRAKLVWTVTMSLPARAFAIEKSIVVGEPEFRERCWERLERMRGEGVTFLVASEDHAALERMCDRAIVLLDGRVVAETSVAEGLAMLPKVKGRRTAQASKDYDDLGDDDDL